MKHCESVVEQQISRYISVLFGIIFGKEKEGLIEKPKGLNLTKSYYSTLCLPGTIPYYLQRFYPNNTFWCIVIYSPQRCNNNIIYI